MNEALLHYIWQHRRYAPLHLQTQCGQKLQVLKTIGNQRIKSIIINTLAPFYVLYSKNKQLPRFQYKSLAILADLEAENNTIVRRFEERGVTVTSSAQS